MVYGFYPLQFVRNLKITESALSPELLNLNRYFRLILNGMRAGRVYFAMDLMTRFIYFLCMILPARLHDRPGKGYNRPCSIGLKKVNAL